MKKGLILEGGAMRGMFTAGVIDVMMENNIEYDGAIGVSAGAVFGCNYKSKQIGRVIRYNSRFINDKRYYGIRCLLTDGNIYSAKFCYGEVPLKYDIFDFDTYHNNPMDFYAVCTDIGHLLQITGICKVVTGVAKGLIVPCPCCLAARPQRNSAEQSAYNIESAP